MLFLRLAHHLSQPNCIPCYNHLRYFGVIFCLRFWYAAGKSRFNLSQIGPNFLHRNIYVPCVGAGGDGCRFTSSWPIVILCVFFLNIVFYDQKLLSVIRRYQKQCEKTANWLAACKTAAIPSGAIWSHFFIYFFTFVDILSTQILYIQYESKVWTHLLISRFFYFLHCRILVKTNYGIMY